MRSRGTSRWIGVVGALGLLTLSLGAGSSRAEGPAPDVLCARGVQAYLAGDLATAVPLLEQALARAPGLTAAGHHLGLALIRLGRLKQGRRALAAAAGQAGGASPRLLHDLGLAYLAEENTAWAVRYLRAASELAPRDERIRYHLGLALIRLGAASEAAQELRRLRFSDVVDQPALKLRLGLAHYRARQWERSRQTLASILLDSKQGAAARELLRASHEAEGIKASLLTIELAAGGALDTNPLYEVEQEGRPLSGRTVLGPSLSGALTVRPWVDEHNLIWGSLRGSRAFYFATADQAAATQRHPGDASTSHIGAAVNYARLLPLGQGRGALQLSTGYSFDLTFLDGNLPFNKEPPLSDPNFIYLEEHSGHVTAQRRHPGGSQTVARYSLTHQAFADPARTNTGIELTVDHTADLGGSLRLLGWLSMKYEAAQAAQYDALAPEVGLGASYLAPLDLLLGVRLGYRLDEHFNSAGGGWQRFDRAGQVVHDGHRLDHELSFSAEISRALPWGTRLRAIYQRLQQYSTVDDFDITRDYLTLNLSWSYQ